MLEADLIVELMELNANLSEEIDMLEVYGSELAEKEYKYQVLNAQKALIMKDKGVTATFISTFIKGEVDVAQARKERDIAEVRYKACQEKINAIKTQIRVVDNQASREWTASRDVRNTLPFD